MKIKWTTVKCENTGKWVLVKQEENNVEITGYVSKELSVMCDYMAYLNYGIAGHLPDGIIANLDSLKASREL